MISILKINKANGHDDIMPFFLIISANIIAHPLSALLNQLKTYSITEFHSLFWLSAPQLRVVSA